MRSTVLYDNQFSQRGTNDGIGSLHVHAQGLHDGGKGFFRDQDLLLRLVQVLQYFIFTTPRIVFSELRDESLQVNHVTVK